VILLGVLTIPLSVEKQPKIAEYLKNRPKTSH
ncbi:unnamed protein product, partial [Adineta steineri]